MKRVWKFLSEYAFVLVVIIVAGMVTGACAIDPLPRPVLPQPDIMIRLQDCKDSEPIRMMPNHLMDWDPKHIERWT